MKNGIHLPIGFTIGNHFEVVKILGQGGFGIVYLVKDIERFDELMVVKELFAREFSIREQDGVTVYNKEENTKNIFEKIKDDIRREVDTLRYISNENIIQAYGYFEENSTIYSIMEYIQGQDLEKYLEENSFNETKAKELLKQMIHGLKDIHIRNIIHRDIKPNNIIRTNSGVYKIIDFTTNRTYSDGAITTITGFQNRLYTPPELVQQKNTTIGNYSDIYSLGITLVSLLVKERDSLPMLMDRFIDNRDFIKVVNGLKISDKFKQVILKMTELKPKDRFQSLEEIEQILFKKFKDRKRVKNIETTVDYNRPLRPKLKEPEPTELPSSSDSWFKNLIIFVIFSLIGFGGYKFYTESNSTPSPIHHNSTNLNKIEAIDLKHDNLTLNLSYKPNVKRGEKVYIKASLTNNGSFAKRGGVTLSFPQIHYITGKVITNTFGGLQKYGTSSKVYNREKREPIYAKYLMIESNDENWKRGEKHSFSIKIDIPKGVDHFTIQLRGALRKRVVPNQGTKDQQGYNCKVITIDVID